MTKWFVNMGGEPRFQIRDDANQITNMGVYVQGEIPFDNWSVTAGIRYDRLTYDIEDLLLFDGDSSDRRVFERVSPKIGVVRRLSDAVSVYGNVSTGFEAPTLGEIRLPAGFNGDVDPQKAINIKGGIRGTAGLFSYDLGVYRMQVTDEILPITIDDATLFFNVAETSHTGIELSARTRPAPWLQLDGTYAYSRFILEEFDELSGNHLPGIPTNQGRVGVAIGPIRGLDGGRTFAPPRRVNAHPSDADVAGEQPATVVLRSSEEVYVVWRSMQGQQGTIVAAYSSDGGQSFSEPQALHDPEPPAFRGFQSAAVGTDGTLYVTWLDGRHSEGPKRHLHAAPRQDVYHGAWKPGGIPREAQVQDDVCFCCKTATAVSPDGTVSLAWRHIYPGSIRDIAFVRQTAGRFAAPTRVSEDHWELAGCPDDGPSLAIDERGGAHLVWPTVVQDPSPAKTVFYATSTDGTAFSRRLAVPRLGGDTMSHPQVTLDGHGRPVVVWDETHDGTPRIGLTYLSTVGATTFRAPISLNTNAPARYPDVAPIPGGVIVAWTSGSVREGSTVAIRPVRLPSSGIFAAPLERSP